VQQVLEDRGDDPDDAPWGELPVGSFADAPYTGEEREPFGSSGGESTTDLVEPMDGDPNPSDSSPRLRGSPELVAENWSRARSVERTLRRERKFTPVFARALRKIFKLQREEVLDNLSQYRSRAMPIDAAQIFDSRDWVELFDAETQSIRQKAFFYAAKESLSLLGITEEFSFTDAVAQAIRLQGATMVKLVNETTAARIRKAIRNTLKQNLTEGESFGQLEKAIGEIFQGRRNNAATIARTEMHKSSQSGQIEAFKQARVPFKTWLDARDSRVRDTHLQEQILPVRLEEDFILPSGARCQYPSDSRLPPEESINCRCDSAPVYGIGDEVPVG